MGRQAETCHLKVNTVVAITSTSKRDCSSFPAVLDSTARSDQAPGGAVLVRGTG